MLEFVMILLPGVLLTYGTEFLMKRRLQRRTFLLLMVFHILALNGVLLALGAIPEAFLHGDGYTWALTSMEYATALIKQFLFTALVGIPLALIEAVLGRFLRLSLDDTRKEASHE